MVGHSQFLRYKTSQIAGAALVMAINIHQSPIAVSKLSLPCQLRNLNARSAFFDSSLETPTEGSKCPLRIWNAGVRRLTLKCVGRDIKPCYKVLIKIANEMEFEGQLSADSSLFPLATSEITTANKK